MYRLRLVNGTWYSNFRHKGKKIQKALKAKGGTTENPPLEVHEELGALVRDVRLGLMPGAHNKKINQIVFKKKLKERSEQILRGKIFPFFGEYTLENINEELIEKYFVFRWGRSLDGNLQAVQNTCLKELNMLQRTMRVLDPTWKLPQIDYIKLKRALLPPLTKLEVEKTASHVQEKFQPIYWIMALTAMDISDVLDLKPKHFTDGLIQKKRGKTDEDIIVGICPKLSRILSEIPRPIGPNLTLFPDFSSKAVSTDVRRAFNSAGLPGYGSKYLRRYVASAFLDQDVSESWIAVALSHAEGSKETKKYTKVYKKKIKEIYAKLG